MPAAEAMKPGQYIWYPQYQRASTSSGPVSIVISIPQQLAFIYQGKRLIGVSTASTGSPGRDTPTGDFTILQKNKFHRSNLYSNAPMPFMQRLTWDGIALHGGHLPGYPASHGCIRLPKDFARDLFAITAMGGAVKVTDEYIDSEPPAITPEVPAVTLAATAPEAPAPTLTAETQGLGGASFDVVTMSDMAPERQPASWVGGPAREMIQPIPPTLR